MTRTAQILIFTFAILLFAAAPAAAQTADRAPQLKGVLLIKWHEEDKFIFVPDDNDPLRFVGRDGREIKPDAMHTDGGSIPRVFWSFKGFSPWGYAPAYIIHDWLFHQHRCKRDQVPNNYTFAQANKVMDEVIDILFRVKKAQPNSYARRSIKWAVDNFGAAAWNGPCTDDLVEPRRRTFSFRQPVTIDRISFSD